MRLLHKTIRTYFLASFVILLVTIPLFYAILKEILARDVDRNLIAQKEAIVRRLDRATPYDIFDLLDALDPDINLSPTPNIRRYDTLYTVPVYDRITREVTPYRFLSSNVSIRGRNYVIELRNSLLSNEDLLQTIVLVQAILLVLIGAALVFVNRKLSGEIWQPFYNTLGRLRQYRVEQAQPVQFALSEVDEFNDLNRALEQLSERNHAVYRSQKEFTENASHEMQTPLAVLQTKLELLMQTDPINEAQAALMGDMADAASRLSRLNRSLLLLTKIENNQYPEREEVDMTQLCRQQVRQLGYQAEARRITIEENGTGELKVVANKVLMEILVSNLLSNAIRYNVDGGIIKIFTGANTLQVQNSSDLPRLQGQKVFERFHKEGGHRQSIGLGLAICKKICDGHGFRLGYDFEAGLHSFTVQFD